MKKSLTKALEALHELTTEQLTKVIRDGIPMVVKGEPVFDPATNEIVRVPAPPAYFAAAIALLRQNGIEVTLEEPKTNQLKSVLQSLPFREDDGPDAFDRLN